MVDDAGSTDRASLEDLISTVAGRLRREGIRRHDVVAFQLPNGIGAALLYRACWRLGAIAAPLHHKMGPREVAAALDQVDPVLVIAGCGLPASEIEGSVVLESPSERFDGLLARFADADPVTRAQCPAKGSDIAAVLFTSGSTGTPKAVLHTHRGLGYKASTMVEVHGIGPRDAVLSPAPLAHISGLLNGVLLPSTAGIPSVLMSTWDPEKALSLIERYEVTFMGAPPVFFTQMAASELFTQRRVATLRLVSTGGASVSPAFIDSTSEIFECRVKRTYGSTEAPTVTTSEPAMQSIVPGTPTAGRWERSSFKSVTQATSPFARAAIPARSGSADPNCSSVTPIPRPTPKYSPAPAAGSGQETSEFRTNAAGCASRVDFRTPSSEGGRTSRLQR